jgi:hypothetical protein
MGLALYLARVRSSDLLGGESPDNVTGLCLEPNGSAWVSSAATIVLGDEYEHVRLERMLAWARVRFEGL